MTPSMNLRSFIEKFESNGELRRISVEVDPFLKITEITNRVHDASGPALLFENIKGSPFPLLINAFGSQKRI
jgi:4-hydroxy-3-polyprenylbenzoate decarboxylase